MISKLVLVNTFFLAFAVLYCNASIRGSFHFKGVPRSFFEGSATYADSFVTIKNGTLKGKTSTTLGQETMYVYQSIPYAKAPVGDLRFRPPQAFEDAWGDDARDATKFPASCPQHAPALSAASEDCLYLNVYTTQAPNVTTNDLPVIVFIHGGGFTSGESTYYSGGKLLINGGVVVVLHYRLGPFGFLSTGDEVSPGNYGLKDQIQALRWVQENIQAFGGDPNNVTIMGESAGAASTIFLLLSPLAKGLFHKVISQSGSAISEWAMHRNPVQSSKTLASLMGCPDGSSAEIVSCLRSLPWQNITEIAHQYEDDAYARFELGLEFNTPVIEPDLPGAVITKEPMVLLKEGEIQDVPVLIGATLHEGSYALGLLYQAALGPQGLVNDSIWLRDELIPSLLKAFGTSKRASYTFAEAIAVAFMPGFTRENFTEITPHVVDMMGAFFMKATVMRTADILSRRLSNVYLYSMEQYSKNSMWTWLFLGETPPPIQPGITHADDLLYLFNMPVIPAPADTAFSKMMSGLWSNFAFTGNPTPQPNGAYPQWPRYKVQDQQFMRLNISATVETAFTSRWRPRGFEPV